MIICNMYLTSYENNQVNNFVKNTDGKNGKLTIHPVSGD